MFFDVFGWTLDNTVHIILILFCIFWDDQTISFTIQPSDSASNPTISTVYPKLVTTYSTPHPTTDWIPNDIFKRIKTGVYVAVWDGIDNLY